MSYKAKEVRRGKGTGYKTKGLTCMVRCFECGRENYALAVVTGYCAWCGHNANRGKK